MYWYILIWPDIVLISDKTCPQPTVNQYSNQTYDAGTEGSFTYRSSVTYTCDVGYIFNDRTRSKSLVCSQENQWTGNIDICGGMNVFSSFFLYNKFHYIKQNVLYILV